MGREILSNLGSANGLFLTGAFQIKRFKALFFKGKRHNSQVVI
jgi:hypothetical protein